MKKLLPGSVFGTLFLLATTSAFAATYYIAATGSNSNPGTFGQPFATMQKGHDVAVAGDTIYIRGGIYKFTGPGPNANCGVYITKSGTSDARRIYFWAYPGEKPVFDFSGLTLATSTGAGIRIDGGSWLHIKGLELCNVPQPGGAANNGLWANPASNCIFEQINSHHNAGPGICIANGTGGNLVLNCDSHENYDPGSTQGDGQNADGFGCHYQKSGPSNVFRGCRAWWNSDDGFDCINQGVAVIVENCWNALSGYKPGTMTSAPSGNGNGFKVGGWGNPPSGYPTPIPVHTVRNCVAFLCKAAGFYQNHHPVSNLYYNNTAYNNGTNFNMLGYDIANGNASAGMGTYRNNIAFTRTATSNSSGADAAYNSWNIAGLAVAASDFESLDTTGVFGPRKPDGSLPEVKFLHLSATGRLMDKGTNVGLPFSGAAPDLGAFEYGATATRSGPFVSGPASGVFSEGNGGLPTIRVFDLSGRRLDNSAITSAFGPLIYKAVRPDGSVRAFTVVKGHGACLQ